jgi:hypothetical protein
VSGALSTLADYLDDVRRVLHDPNDQYWSVADKTVYINSALEQRDLDTGQNRHLYRFTMTPGQDIYAFQDLAAQNPDPPIGPTTVPFNAASLVVPLSPVQAVGYQVRVTPNWTTTAVVSAAVAASFTVTFGTPAPAGAILYWQLAGGTLLPNATEVFDVIGVNLIYGATRVVMGQYSFTELNTTVRQYVPSISWAPVRWCRYGPNQLVFAPAPAIAYVTEWDCSTIGPALVNLTDSDLLPVPYTKAVKYYAAHLAKINERRPDEAAQFLAQYQQNLLGASNSRAGSVPNMYSAGMTRL